MKMTPSRSPRQACSKHVLLNLKGQFQNLTSCQVKVRSRSDYDPSRSDAHPLKRLDEPSLLAPFACLYLHPVATYWRKMDCDVI